MSKALNQERLMTVLLGPHVSEKSTDIGERHNQIVFKVRHDATKAEIRQAVDRDPRPLHGCGTARQADHGQRWVDRSLLRPDRAGRQSGKLDPNSPREGLVLPPASVQSIGTLVRQDLATG